MKRDAVQFSIALIALVFGGAAEDLMPKFLGVGMPFLLSAAAVIAVRRPPLEGALFAIAAGAFEDALSGLPGAVSISYFTLMAGIMRGFKLHLACAAPAFCGYQLWLWIWLGGSLSGNVFSRIFIAAPIGAGTLVAVHLLLLALDRKGAVGEK